MTDPKPESPGALLAVGVPKEGPMTETARSKEDPWIH